MSTPTEHIEAMRAAAERIQNIDFIHNCIVDDWGRYSNFQLIVYVKDDAFKNTNKGLLTRRIKKAFNDALKDTGAHLREIFSPTPIYRNIGGTSYGKRIVDRYDRTYWMVDVDFKQYNKESNFFS